MGNGVAQRSSSSGGGGDPWLAPAAAHHPRRLVVDPVRGGPGGSSSGLPRPHRLARPHGLEEGGGSHGAYAEEHRGDGDPGPLEQGNPTPEARNIAALRLLSLLPHLDSFASAAAARAAALRLLSLLPAALRLRLTAGEASSRRAAVASGFARGEVAPYARWGRRGRSARTGTRCIWGKLDENGTSRWLYRPPVRRFGALPAYCRSRTAAGSAPSATRLIVPDAGRRVALNSGSKIFWRPEEIRGRGQKISICRRRA
jgi:hypothetical protein